MESFCGQVKLRTNQNEKRSHCCLPAFCALFSTLKNNNFFLYSPDTGFVAVDFFDTFV